MHCAKIHTDIEPIIVSHEARQNLFNLAIWQAVITAIINGYDWQIYYYRKQMFCFTVWHFFYVTKDACACNTVFDVTHHLIGQLLVLLEGSVERDPLWDFDIYFTEFGAALRTVLPVLFKYCYKYCYSDSRKLWAVMKGGGLAL
jgi:hypothetical protein